MMKNVFASCVLVLVIMPRADLLPQSSRACWLVTPAEAAQILGKPELAKGEVIRDDHLSCDYLPAGFDVHVDDPLTPAQRSAALRESIKQGKAEPVSGIGDEAAFSAANAQNHNTSELIVLKGSRRVSATIFRWDGPPAQIRPTLVNLARTALTKLFAPVTPQTSRACWVITPAEAAQILGNSELATGKAMHDDVDSCEYKNAGFDVDITYFTRAPKRGEAFGGLIKRGRAEAAPDIGDDAAFTRDPGSNDQVLAVVMGERIMKITLLQSSHTPEAEARPKLVKLATTAVARLR
jgi:hypothetical protein